jgi:hypothetical protein
MQYFQLHIKLSIVRQCVLISEELIKEGKAIFVPKHHAVKTYRAVGDKAPRFTNVGVRRPN